MESSKSKRVNSDYILYGVNSRLVASIYCKKNCYLSHCIINWKLGNDQIKTSLTFKLVPPIENYIMKTLVSVLKNFLSCLKEKLFDQFIVSSNSKSLINRNYEIIFGEIHLS